MWLCVVVCGVSGDVWEVEVVSCKIKFGGANSRTLLTSDGEEVGSREAEKWYI